MASQLAEAVVKRNEPAIEHITSSLKHNDNWSLITIIDELLPLMLMESNTTKSPLHCLVCLSLLIGSVSPYLERRASHTCCLWEIHQAE